MPVRRSHSYRPAAAADFVEGLQARGRFGFALDKLLAETELSPAAAVAQLRRLAPSVIALYPRVRYYLIVPPEHRVIGAPPVTWWIDDFFAAQQEHYYLGLLTAAAQHGAQHQVPQVTQVITGRPRRPIQLGRQKIVFITKKSISHTPIIRAAGGHAPYLVSTAEATALDLVRYPDHTGGIARATELIAELKPKLTVTGFRRALAAPLETTLLQRMGFLLAALGMEAQSRLFAAALKNRRLQPTDLDAGTPIATTPRNRWNVQGHLPEVTNA